ncbi:MAG: type II secretion system protein [Planctomycetota bacterium]|nr:MAG: type II secretion system protein [Planctomycetota bacterium]
MRNYLLQNNLRSVRILAGRRPGFTLAELVVSIGVLVLMFALAGQVFSLSIRSSGQATAVTEISQLVRDFEQTLRADLAGVQPGRSLLLIQGNPINAYWTVEGQEADTDGRPDTGYPHEPDPEREDAFGNLALPRADMLMFFTARKGASIAHAGVTAGLQQVVYGHAVLGNYVPDPNLPSGSAPAYLFQPGPDAFPADETTGYPDPLGVSRVPAEQWHLARRSVLLVPSAPPVDPAVPWADALGAPPDDLGSDRLLRGATDVIGNFDYERLVVQPGSRAPWFLPAVFPAGDPFRIFARTRLDPQPPPSLSRTLGSYFFPHCASFKVEWTLDPRSDFVAGRLDGLGEVLWFDPGDAADPLAALQNAIERADAAGDTALRDRLDNLLNQPTLHPDAARFEADANLECDGNDAMFEYSLSDRFRGKTLLQGSSETAWAELAPDRRPNLVVFGASRRRQVCHLNEPDEFEPVPEDIFPTALRITIDVYDRERRLDRPQRFVMVIPVGRP